MKSKKTKFVLSRGLDSWEQLLLTRGADGVLADFRENLGGDVEFLKHLWCRYVEESKPAISHEQWGRVLTLAEKLYRALHKPALDSLAPDDLGAYFDAIVAVQSVGAFVDRQRKTLPRTGRPIRAQPYYWCAALLPYFDLKGRRGDRWAWMARWFQLIECSVVGSGSLETWWKSRAVAPMVARCRRTSTPKAGMKTMRIGWPPFEAAFEYIFWRELAWDSKEAVSYRSLVLRRMPFLENFGW